MTDQPENTGLERRLLATGYDRDNFPRMNSERWLPVGLAKEAAAEIKRLSAQRESREQGLRDRAAEITRLRTQRDELLATLRLAREYVVCGASISKQIDVVIAAGEDCND